MGNSLDKFLQEDQNLDIVDSAEFMTDLQVSAGNTSGKNLASFTAGGSVAKKAKRWTIPKGAIIKKSLRSQGFQQENIFTRYTKADISMNDTILGNGGINTSNNSSSLSEAKSGIVEQLKFWAIPVTIAVVTLVLLCIFLHYLEQRRRIRQNDEDIGRLLRMRYIDGPMQRAAVATAMQIIPEGNADRSYSQNESTVPSLRFPEEEPQEESETKDIPPVTEHTNANLQTGSQSETVTTLNETPVELDGSKEKVEKAEIEKMDDDDSDGKTG